MHTLTTSCKPGAVHIWVPAFRGDDIGFKRQDNAQAATSSAATSSTSKRYIRPRESVAHQQSRFSS